MIDDLPNRPDDPRLDGWYHTIDLGNGLISRGVYDHRPIVNCYGLPDSLCGKTVLDVGTADGFWAFEMERRGADRVVAIDIACYGDFDWLPQIRAKMGLALEVRGQTRFNIAHALRRSRVEYMICSVYELSPETVGVFDVVFCGSLLLHLQNPIKALVNIRSVTKEFAIVETLVERELEERFPNKPWLSFGYRHRETELGEGCIYWEFSTRALEEMLTYTGFAYTQREPVFTIPPTGDQATAVVAWTSISPDIAAGRTAGPQAR